MSPPPWRIRSRSTFLALAQDGRRVRRGPLTVTYADDGEARAPLVAYSVGRRVGGAVQRNRLRRRLRAAVAEVATELQPGAYLFGAAPAASHLRYSELRDLVHETVVLLRRNEPE